MYSNTAHAIDNPSRVLVPLPISSMMIRLLFVAFFKILAVSFISTKNVDWPRARLSDVPIRVNILSTNPTVKPGLYELTLIAHAPNHGLKTNTKLPIIIEAEISDPSISSTSSSSGGYRSLKIPSIPARCAPAPAIDRVSPAASIRTTVARCR